MEEFIFDDEMNDVGAEIEAHCPKCHSTAHTIVSKYEDEVRRVQCNACGHVHPYKKPRDEDEVEPVAPVKKKAQKQKPNWDQMMAKSKKPPRPYDIAEYFKELEVLTHPKFGVGFVTENIGNDKVEVTFQSDKRVLIHNRKGLNLPIAVMGTAQKSGKGLKKGKVAPVAAPPSPPPPAAKPAPAAKGKAPKAEPAAKGKAPKAAAPAKPAAKARPPAARPARAAKPTRPARPQPKAAARPARKPQKPVAKKPAKAAAKKKR